MTHHSMSGHSAVEVHPALCKRGNPLYMNFSFQLAAKDFYIYAPSDRQDSVYNGVYYTSHGALARMRNSSIGPP